MSINHKNFSSTTLASAITTTDGTSIVVTSEASFPAIQFIISIDTEAMLVTTVAGTTWTVTRGYEGSTAATHLNGASIFHDISAAEADSIAAKLPLAGGTLTGNLIMDNMDVTLVKLLTLHGEIDDGNSGTAKLLDWNAGMAHKSTLTGNVTLTFTGSAYLVPVMTGNTTPSGVCSISSGTQDEYKVFDRNDATYSVGPGFFNAGDWIQYAFGVGITVIATSYSIKYNDATHDATGWKVQGSNNASDWTDLDIVSQDIGGTKTTFAIDTPAAYRYYRILFVTSPHGADIAPDTFDLLSGVIDPVTPCFVTLKLVQDGTGGRTVTWPATVKGTPNVNMAANATSIAYLYWDGTNYYVINEASVGTGNGDVVGPLVATPGNVATFADDTGKNIQDGGVIPTTLPASDVSAWAKDATKPTYTPGEVGAEAVANKSTNVPTDAASDTKYPSVKAVKDYADGLVAGLLNYRGAYDASVNTYPTTGGSGTAGAVMKGDMWAISAAGVLGGVSIQGGDVIIAKINTPAQTAANWNALNTNISYVPENQANKENTTLDTSTTKYPTNALVKTGLDGKAPTSHAHAESDVTNLTTDLAAKAPLAPTGAAYTPATGAQTVALDVATVNMHVVTGHASGTAITFTVTGATNNQPFIVSILQGATAVSTITAWFATIRWAGGTAPTLTATLNKRDTFGFIRTGANTYDGFVIGQNA